MWKWIIATPGIRIINVSQAYDHVTVKDIDREKRSINDDGWELAIMITITIGFLLIVLCYITDQSSPNMVYDKLDIIHRDMHHGLKIYDLYQLESLSDTKRKLIAQICD